MIADGDEKRARELANRNGNGLEKSSRQKLRSLARNWFKTRIVTSCR
jgi:hypothetical protein